MAGWARRIAEFSVMKVSLKFIGGSIQHPPKFKTPGVLPGKRLLYSLRISTRKELAVSSLARSVRTSGGGERTPHTHLTKNRTKQLYLQATSTDQDHYHFPICQRTATRVRSDPTIGLTQISSRCVVCHQWVQDQSTRTDS